MIGDEVYKDRLKQRQALTNAASPETVLKCFRLNAELIALTDCRDFYLDPHTKHYTGEKNVLKGWVGSLGRVDKAIHSDFIHTAQGYPAYFETTDNYLDLRERIFPFLERFRTELQFEETAKLTFVIDRGIFSANTFREFIDTEPIHIITWEKNYKPGEWDETREADGQFQLLKERNNSTDLRTYKFTYQDGRWNKNEKMRRLIIRATNPKGRTIEVAVLSDDCQRSCQEIIELIFNRWLQENDFKYLEKHFGINQITSYKAISYEELRDELDEKMIMSGHYKSLKKEKQNHTIELKNLLLKREKCQWQQRGRNALLSELERQKEVPDTASEKPESGGKYSDSPDRMKTISNLKGQLKRAEKNIQKWGIEIEGKHDQLAKTEDEIEKTQKEVSRIDDLIEKQAIKLQGSSKKLMDVLKMLGRNAFYHRSESFRKHYDNRRDDHVIFRSLTVSGGLIEASEESVTAHLFPEPDYPTHQRRLLEADFAQFNEAEPEFPDGSARVLVVKFADPSGIEIGHKTREIGSNH